MVRACSTNGGKEECIWDIGGKAKGNRPLGRQRRRWVDSIKMDLRDGIEWIELARDRDRLRALVNMVNNLRVP
jgi:hypothetical protein